ncbi:MAG: DotA/TraY family protein [Nitrospirota bacterium]|nr:DotA/TraY family protein [Nitrospirota bacterium]
MNRTSKRFKGVFALAIAKVSGKTLVRAGKRAFDFRQPALPGLDPAPGQDLPALPPPRTRKEWETKTVQEPKTPVLSGTEKSLEKSTDWRKRPLWMWVSGGGWKGLLGARRYWSVAARYFLDSLGRIAWTFHFVAIKPLLFATAQAARFGDAVRFFRSRLHLCRIQPVHVPPKAVLRRIFLHNAIPPMVGGATLLGETVLLDQITGLPDSLFALSVIAGLLAVSFPVVVFEWCRGKLGNPALLAGFAIPSFVHSAPGSLAGCVLHTFFGSAAGQNTCSGSSLSSSISNSTVLAALPSALSVVASLVSILALFLLTVTYGYHLVQAMHTAAHTGDWTHQGVNAAWAPIRGAVSAAMIAAPGGLSILASFILFVAGTGNGLGDTAASKIANMLTAPKPAAVVPPNIQTVADNALYSLVCAHVLDNFVNPQGTVQAVTAQMDNFGNLDFSNVAGVGSYGPSVCGSYMLPGGSGQSMAQNAAFMGLIQQGGPLDQVAASIASGVNGCGAIVVGTGLSPCAPPGTPPNRSVYGQGGGMSNPAGSSGQMTQAVTEYMTALGQMAVASTGNGGNALQNIQTEGWVSLGMYYSFFGSEARRAARTAEHIPVPTTGFGGADFSSIAGSEAEQEVQNAFKLTSTYLGTWGFAGSTGTGPWWASVPQSTTGPGAEQSKIQSLYTIQNSSGQSVSVPSYMASNPGEDPLSRLQNVVESADTALAVGQAARWGLSRLGNALNTFTGPAGKAVGQATSALSGVGKLLDPLTTVMGILTVVVAVYLPLVPMLAILFYSLFWILEVVILAVFAPLWGLAVGIPQGEGFIGQHGKEGLSRVTDIALRPLLLVGMFVVSLGLYFLGSALLVPMTSEVLAGMSSTPSPGIWISTAGLIGGYLAYVLVLWRVIHFSFEIIHTGPYWAMKILGIESRDGREGRHMEAGGREILTNIRTVVSGFRGMGPGKGGQA